MCDYGGGGGVSCQNTIIRQFAMFDVCQSRKTRVYRKIEAIIMELIPFQSLFCLEVECRNIEARHTEVSLYLDNKPLGTGD